MSVEASIVERHWLFCLGAAASVSTVKLVSVSMVFRIKFLLQSALFRGGHMINHFFSSSYRAVGKHNAIRSKDLD